MKKYKCLIVDDETLARELISTYISRIDFLEEVASCSNAVDALSHLRTQKIDILFLDIEMPEINGLELAKSLITKPAIILTTAYSEYAIEGYDIGITDYLLKPIQYDRFFRAITKVVENNEVISDAVSKAIKEQEKEEYFFVKSNNKFVSIKYNDLFYIEALQKYIRLHCRDSRIVTLMSLSKIESLLPKSNFARIHRSFIVNIDKIDSIEGNLLTLQGDQLMISKGQKESFMQAIKEKGLFQ